MTEMGGGQDDLDQEDLVRLNQSRESLNNKNATSRTVLNLVIHEGKLLRDTEMFGAMDPYIIVKYQDEIFKTKAIDGGGKLPQWNETFSIPLKSIDD